MTTQDVADYIGISVHTLNKYRSNGTGPDYLKVGNRVRYRRSDVDYFLGHGARAAHDRNKDRALSV